MSKVLYGKTFWGKEFLNIIENETDDGRLSRGRTYANTNKVYDIILNSNSIKAKIIGKYEPYYNASMSFKKLIKGDINYTINFINENPLILASIVNGKLPKELLDFLKKNEINIFDSFVMGCDCFDFYGSYACKHISALYYILANEIDKNPFILFSLRGLDLVEQYDVHENLEIAYPIKLEYIDAISPTNLSKHEANILKFENLKSFILSLLESNPSFSNIDYKESLEEFYKKSEKELTKIIFPIKNEDTDKIQRILQNCDISIIGDTNIIQSIFKLESDLFKKQEIKNLFQDYEHNWEKNTLFINPINLLELFISCEDDFGSDSYKYLFYLFRVVYIFIQNSAFIPSVAKLDKNKINIIYKPLISIPQINEQINILSGLSSGILKIENKQVEAKSETNFIISAILTSYVDKLDFMHKKQKSNPPKISLCFFKLIPLNVGSFEYQHIPKAISNYFAIFDLIESSYNYKIFIEGVQNNYILYMKIQNKNNKKEYMLTQTIQEDKNSFNKIEILKFISFLSSLLPQLKDLIDNQQINLGEEELEVFILEKASILSNLSVQIVLPKELKELLKPKISLNIKSKNSSLTSFFKLDDILQYNWQLSIGGEQISIKEFEKLVKENKKLIKFKDKYITLSPSEAKNIFKQISQAPKLNKFDILQAKINNEASFDKPLSTFFDNIFKTKSIDTPPLLNANLRAYQKRGFEWSVNNLLNGFGLILADDMGLGKTIQTISILLYLKQNKYIKNLIVIIVPTSLLNNWENELQQFAPSLEYFCFYGNKRNIKKTDILISTYGIITRDIELFKKQKIDCLIIDEAQKIKNPNTNTTKAIKSLKAKYKIALSGTPMENNLSELWSIFDFALPKYLKSLKEFTNNYAKDIEIKKDIKKINKLKKITAPFMLRRLKTDKNIISDLPTKIIIDEYTTMSKQQASLYKAVVDKSISKIQEGNSQGEIFKLITSLKQICNHPRNFDKTSKIDASLSGKSKLLLNLLENILLQDEKVLIFTQYTQMGDILVEMINNHLLTTPLYLKGSMSKIKRDEAVHKFQNDNKYKIFILSLKAGGVGLNLTSANHIIHYDLWFNPAVENQATDRAFRIGQKKNVNVYRLITKNSFEEKIDKIIKAKQELNNLSISIGESWLKDMNKDELKEIFS